RGARPAVAGRTAPPVDGGDAAVPAPIAGPPRPALHPLLDRCGCVAEIVARPVFRHALRRGATHVEAAESRRTSARTGRPRVAVEIAVAVLVPEATRPTTPPAAAHAGRAILEAEIEGGSALGVTRARAAQRFARVAGLGEGDALPRRPPAVVRDAVLHERPAAEAVRAVLVVRAGTRAEAFARGPHPHADAALRALRVGGACAAEIAFDGEVADARLGIAAMAEGAVLVVRTARSR